MNDDVPALVAVTNWVVAAFSEFVLYEVEVMTVWHGFCETIVVMVVVTTASGLIAVAMHAICELLLLFCTENVHNTTNERLVSFLNTQFYEFFHQNIL